MKNYLVALWGKGRMALQSIQRKTVTLATVTAVAVSANVVIGMQSAYAALPASATTTITGVQTDGQSMFDLVFPVIGVFVGLSLLIKLFKRFTRAI
jgi:TRAP-type C4-dicarboxylate transport system permease small subunit